MLSKHKLEMGGHNYTKNRLKTAKANQLIDLEDKQMLRNKLK